MSIFVGGCVNNLMQVICKDNSYYPLSLCLNCKYKVIKETDISYIIIDENKEEHNYPKEIFEVEKYFDII